MTEAMTEAEWLARTNPFQMQWYLNKSARLVEKGSKRRLRLFGCACCRRIWHLLKKRKKAEATRISIETAERFADGLATEEELRAAEAAAAGTGRWPSYQRPWFAATESARAAAKELAVRGGD